MKGNSMKKIGVVFLFFVSLFAMILTWDLNLLSTFGGICVVGLCFGAGIIMWLDIVEPLEPVGKKDDNRTKVKN